MLLNLQGCSEVQMRLWTGGALRCVVLGISVAGFQNPGGGESEWVNKEENCPFLKSSQETSAGRLRLQGPINSHCVPREV